MKNIYAKICTIAIIFLLAITGNANNCLVSTIPVCTQQDATANTTKVKFNVKWENSWRDANNFDAIWVFAKYQKVTSGVNSNYKPCTLGTSDGNHSVPAGFTVRASSDGKGVYIYRTGNGTGNVNLANVLLQWNYGSDAGMEDSTRVRIKVFAVEMVYVPTGPFYVGDGNSDGFQFQKTYINTANATSIADRMNPLAGSGYPATNYTGGSGLLVNYTTPYTGTGNGGLQIYNTSYNNGGFLASFTPTNISGGTGYTAGEWVYLQGGNNDALYQIGSVTTGGTGLTVNITSVFNPISGSSGAQVSYTGGAPGISNGSISITNGGSGFQSWHVGYSVVINTGSVDALYQIGSVNTAANTLTGFSSANASGPNTSYTTAAGVSIAPVGSITGLSVNTAGSGYKVNQVVNIVLNGYSGATAKVTSIDGGGGVTGLTLVWGGTYSYWVKSNVATTPGAMGVPLTISAPLGTADLGTGYSCCGGWFNTAYPATMISVNSGGYGYQVGQVFAILQGVISQGTAYTRYNASVTVTSVSPSPVGAVTGVSLTSAGTGYVTGTALETNSSAHATAGVQFATKYGCTFNLTGGSLSAGIAVTAGGQNYYPGDLLTVVQGANITGQVIVTGTSSTPGPVTSVMVHTQFPGSGYSGGAATSRADENFNGYPTGLYAVNVQNNPSYPNGYNAFMCMKYEVCNGAFADFMNTLDYNNQTYMGLLTNPTLLGSYNINSGSHDWMGVRVQTVGVNNSLPAVWGTSMYGNTANCGTCLDGRDVACTGLSPKEMTAWLDWAGLRPMSEMEYEKACRGPVAPVAGEFAWGSTSIYDRNTMWPNTCYDEMMNYRGAGNDSLEYLSNISNTAGNGAFGGPGYGYLNISGNSMNNPYTCPMKNGQFASAVARQWGLGSCNRVNTGASYWGIMELSGNLAEFCYTYKAKYNGSNQYAYYESIPPFQGQSGDGMAYNFWPGGADVAGWTNGSDGWCYRGGSFKITTRPTNGRVSDRVFSPKYHYRTLEAGLSWGNYDNWIGFRGVRSVATGW